MMLDTYTNEISQDSLDEFSYADSYVESRSESEETSTVSSHFEVSESESSSSEKFSDAAFASERLKDFLEVAAKGLLAYPEDFSLDISTSEDSGLLARLSCNPEDTGRLIGKRGRTIKALRALCWALGQRLGTLIEIEVMD